MPGHSSVDELDLIRDTCFDYKKLQYLSQGCTRLLMELFIYSARARSLRHFFRPVISYTVPLETLSFLQFNFFHFVMSHQPILRNAFPILQVIASIFLRTSQHRVWAPILNRVERHQYWVEQTTYAWVEQTTAYVSRGTKETNVWEEQSHQLLFKSAFIANQFVFGSAPVFLSRSFYYLWVWSIVISLLYIAYFLD